MGVILLEFGCPLGLTSSSSFPTIQKLHPTSSFIPPHHLLTAGHILKKNARVFAKSKSRVTLCSALPTGVSSSNSTHPSSFQSPITSYAKLEVITQEKESQSGAVVRDRSVSVVLLAGGKGKRMGVSSLSISISLLFFFLLIKLTFISFSHPLHYLNLSI